MGEGSRKKLSNNGIKQNRTLILFFNNINLKNFISYFSATPKIPAGATELGIAEFQASRYKRR